MIILRWSRTLSPPFIILVKRVFLLKLDFEKVFDKFNWSFLLKMLKTRGFSDRWIDWIRLGLCSGISSVLVNDVKGRKFHCKRGLHQGGPLSPYLFILVADVFTRIIYKGKDHNLIQGLDQPKNDIISLQYADDTLLLSISDGITLSNLKILLYHFENASGLNINFGKSLAIWLGGVELNQ